MLLQGLAGFPETEMSSSQQLEHISKPSPPRAY